ncbi:hypothetical protein PVW51_05780 [Sulfitobacter sp. PR48]|uniref:hypothetical protein n=1 Tax=Sulfitobacter sp. PR48 TaxID=3028383 RepID=UPI00237BD514|nr:hypothetical protein [Sulfitobacter sp. PR48]MDD9720192.1 hypothetical protein [Sulfitobacter sp. PR48]
MTFLRPEAAESLWRWREVIAGAVLGLTGLWLVAVPGFLLAVVGYPLIAAGAGLAWIGLQRLRFRAGRDGPGAVQVDEGEVTYFGPLTGGTVALREMQSLTLERNMYPAHWRLEQPGQSALLIPVNAAGSEALFDAFATLPGIRTERMLGELRAGGVQSVVIWQRHVQRPPVRVLH